MYVYMYIPAYIYIYIYSVLQLAYTIYRHSIALGFRGYRLPDPLRLLSPILNPGARTPNPTLEADGWLSKLWALFGVWGLGALFGFRV